MLVSEYSQVSEINSAVIRKLRVKSYLSSAEQQKQQENFVFVCYLKTCLVSYSHGFILKLIALAYATFLVRTQQVPTFVMLMFMLVLTLMSQCKPGFSYLMIRIFNFYIFVNFFFFFFFLLWHDLSPQTTPLLVKL